MQNRYGLGDRRRQDQLLRACGEQGVAFVPFFAIAGAGREAGAAAPTRARSSRSPAAHGAPRRRSGWPGPCSSGPHVLAIPGTGDPDHLAENVAAGALRLTPGELARLDAIHQDQQ